MNNYNILVTGGTGMLGKHLQKYFPKAQYIGTKQFDLTRQCDVEKCITNDIDIIIHLAARVGGIIDNIRHPVEFYEENTLMNTLVLRQAHLCGVKHVIAIASSCAYPDQCNVYPIKENMLHDGAPTKSNLAYAYSKRSMAVHVEAYRNEYNKEWCVLFPCNLFSEYEIYNPEKSHFLNSLIYKIIDAKQNNKKTITLFGSGKPLRQFMYADDLARAIYKIVERQIYQDMNIATKENYSIEKIARMALDICEADDIEIKFDHNQPDGQYRKDIDSSKFLSHFPNFEFTSLQNGIKKVFNILTDTQND